MYFIIESKNLQVQVDTTLCKKMFHAFRKLNFLFPKGFRQIDLKLPRVSLCHAFICNKTVKTIL